MRQSILLSVFIIYIISSCASEAQIWKEAKKQLGLSDNSSLTEKEAGQGIKEALIKGITKGVEDVSQLDGYFKNPEIKILFPPEARSVESKLRSIGLDKEVDKVILTINRAAEDAAVEAKDIFIEAIKGLSFQDAVGIVTGEKDAATQYLKSSTSQQLTRKFEPIIESSLEKVDATKYWTDIINTHNMIPFVKKINPDLEAYVTEKAISGLFIMIAQEELAIRDNPGERTTEILKKVFGR